MNDVAAECQLVARNLVKYGAQMVSFEPIKEQLTSQKQELPQEAENTNDRKKYRREQPLIDENIRQRGINDDMTTEPTDSLLKRDKNKMELLLNPVLNAEIFIDQKVLFDLSVQLQFGKKSTIIRILSKELLHYLNDFPLEAILESDKLVEQLILFGNSNDSELLTVCSEYMKVLFKKMLDALLKIENNNYKKAQESHAARSHLLSLADQEHLRISYPSLDQQQYTKENFQTRVSQSSTKIYSFITLMDAMIKNSFNLFTEDTLVASFVCLVTQYIDPLLTKLKQLNAPAVRRLSLGYLKIFQRLAKQVNLKDDRCSLIVAPAIKASLLFLQLTEGQALSSEEFAGLKDYFYLVYDCYLAYLLPKSDIQLCFTLSSGLDKQLHQLDADIEKMLVAVEYARDLVQFWRKGDTSQGYLSDKLALFKKTHAKLQRAVTALCVSPEKSELIELYVLNHLKATLLNQKESKDIDPEFNHYSESLCLITQLVAQQVDSILAGLLREFLAQFESASTVGFPGIGHTAKELAYVALSDSQLSCSLILPGLCHENAEISNLAIDLFWAIIKKEIERAQVDPRFCNSLLPIIISLSKTNVKARSVLDNLHKKQRISHLSQTFISIFSKEKRTRVQAYSNIFKLEFFDTCLSFTSPVGIVSDANVQLPGLSSASLPFSDPLEGIVDPQGRVAFVEKLAAFPDKAAQRGRITQAQIKSLFELLNISLNSYLEFNVRGVALDQMAEAVYFYNDSQALKEFCFQLMDVCRDNLNQFGSKRENFSMLLASLKPLDESFISSKSASELPIQNKYYDQEKSLAVKFLTVYNSILHHFKHLGQTRVTELESLFTQENNKGFCRSLWIISTEKELQHRYQALLLLNLVFTSGISIHSMLCTDLFDRKLAFEERGAGCFPIFEFISKDYFTLYKGILIEAIENQHPLRNISEEKQGSILAFIESFTELSASQKNKHLSFDPEVNREKIAGYLIENRLTACISSFSKSIKQNGQASSMVQWSNIALLASYMGRTEFFEQKALLEAYFSHMKDLLSQGKDELFLEFNSCLRQLLQSRMFRHQYTHLASLKNFIEWVTIYYHTKLLPLVYEIHVESFAEKHDLILDILSLMTTSVRLSMASNDQKLLITMRKFISSGAFLEFLADILRKYEAMDLVSTTLVEFVRWHYDLYVRSEGENSFQQCVQFMFDSSLICTRTDNFIGNRRLFGILKLAHNIVTRNLLLTGGSYKAIFEDMKDMKKEDLPLPVAFKTSTIAWIVSLLDHRCIAVRMMCWNLVANYFDSALLELFPSIIDNAIATLNLVNEAAGVLSLCYFFLFKCCKLISTLDCIGSLDSPLCRTISKEEFIRKIHDRKAIETVRRILAQDSCPPMLLSNCLRFAIQWFSLDPHSLVNKYFHSDFLDKLSHHLSMSEADDLTDYDVEKVRLLTERLANVATILNFLIVTSRGHSNNCHVLLKTFSMIEVVLGWLAHCSRVLKAPIHLQGEFQRDERANTHHKTLQASVVELAKNGVHLLEVLIYEDKETFIHYLEDHEANQPTDSRLFSVVADLMSHDNSTSGMGYGLLKLVSKVLLSWERGYQLLDSEDSATQIAGCLADRCMQFFKSIDYLKISDSDYLKIIGSEEIIHVLAVIVAKSDRIKEKVLQSGLFQLYVTKFLQIIRSFKKDINFLAPSHRKDQTFKSVKTPVTHSRSQISTESTKKGLLKTTKVKEDAELSTKMTRLNQNIRLITENSSGHIKSYILVAKYFFHNASKGSSLSKDSTDLLEARIGDLMEIVNFLWIEGQSDDVVFCKIGNNGEPSRTPYQLAHEPPVQLSLVQAIDRSEVYTPH